MFDLQLILVDGLAGAISGLLGLLIAKRYIDREKKPQLFAMTVILFVVAGAQIIPAFLNPQVRAWRAPKEIGRVLDSDPLYQRVLANHPELREPLTQRFAESYITGNRELSTVAGATILGPLLPEYIGRAPDNAVVGFFRAQSNTMKTLQSDGDRCFQFANPSSSGAVVLTDKEGRNETYEAVKTLFLSAGEEPIVDAAVDGEALLGAVSDELYETYGDEVGILATPDDPNLDRVKYCEILVALYDRILALPETESAGVVRFMMAPGFTGSE